jgi:acyl transferase domain-containing protein
MQDGKKSLQDAEEASTGVYVGCVWQEYQVLLDYLQVTPTVAVLTGSGMNFMVGRVSYSFGLQGTSYKVP